MRHFLFSPQYSRADAVILVTFTVAVYEGMSLWIALPGVFLAALLSDFAWRKR